MMLTLRMLFGDGSRPVCVDCWHGCCKRAKVFPVKGCGPVGWPVHLAKMIGG